MTIGNFVYDTLVVLGVIFAGTIILVGTHSAVQSLYWAFVDWCRSRKK